MYRYGDGTQFPLEENFIETLSAAVESCAAAYTPLADLDDRKERAREAKRQAEKEIAKLAELDDAFEQTGARWAPSTGRTATPVQQVAAKAVAGAKQAVQSARAQIQQRVQQLEGESTGTGLGSQIKNHLAPFFEKHALPNAVWAIAWDARGSVANGQAVASASKISAHFDFAVGGAWGTGIRIELLQPGIVVVLPKPKKGGIGKPLTVNLDKHALVAFERNGGQTTLIVRENQLRPSPGWRFTETGGSVVCVPLDQNNDIAGSDLVLSPDDSTQMMNLGNAAAKALEQFKASRQLRDLKLGNQSVDTHPMPRAVIDAILLAMTPLTRSLKEKSRAQGELVLKRDIGDHRREELFVPRAQLAAMFSPLPPEYKKLFEDMGLAREQTSPGALAKENTAVTDVSDVPTVVVEGGVVKPVTSERPSTGTLPPPPGGKAASST